MRAAAVAAEVLSSDNGVPGVYSYTRSPHSNTQRNKTTQLDTVLAIMMDTPEVMCFTYSQVKVPPS